MKKIFSAFLLMTMMVFSVGSFVSCSDLENELAQVEGTANDNAAAIESLNSELAALKTALSAAQADADAAMAAAKAAKEAGDAAKAEAEAAKAAAEQAKAEAIAAVMAEVEAIQTAIAQNVEAITNLSGSVNANAVEIEALQEEIKALQTAAAEHLYVITNLDGTVKNHEMAIEDLKTELSVLQNTLVNYEKNLKELGLEDDALWTSISENLEAITNLQGRVDAQQMAIEDLMPAFEDVVAQVKTLNDSLIAIYDILGVLANQIQSVVFVPEYNTGLVYAERFGINTDTDPEYEAYTNYLATATYEVRPAKLAESLTSENLSFTTVDLKSKAAAAPETFGVELISADASTGRIVVRALISDKDGARKNDSDYDKMAAAAANAKVVALSLNIASIDVTELLIADSEPVNVDMVSSEYVMVEAKTTDLEAAVGFATKSGSTKGVSDSYKNYNTTNTKGISMPWNETDSQKALFNTEVVVLIQGEHYSLAEANAILGTSLALKYPANAPTNFAATYYNPSGSVINTDEEDAPIKVTGKTLEATAELVPSEDYEDDDAVNAYARVQGTVNVVNGTATLDELEADAKYTIVNKQSDFKFSNVEQAWKHGFEDDVNILTDNDKDFIELAVNGFDKFNETVTISTFKTTINPGTADAYDVTATVQKMSSKAVKITSIGALPFVQGESKTYTFKGVVTHNKVDYTVTFDVTLGAMPEDEVIDLGTHEVYASTTDFMYVKTIDPVAQAIKRISAYDSSVNMKDTKNCFVDTKATPKANVDGVTEGYTAVMTVGTAWDSDNEVQVETSQIKLSKVKAYENTVVVVKTYTFCGVTYTYKTTIVTKEPQLSIAPNNVYVTNGVASVDGTVDFDIETTSTSHKTVARTPFALNAIDLRNLVHVAFPEGVAGTDYKLRYTLTTPMYKEDGTTPLYANVVNAGDEFAAYSGTELPEVANGVTTTSVNKLNWNTDLSELTFEIALVSANLGESKASDDIVFGEPVTVTVKVPELVKITADKTVNQKYVNGVETSTNIVSALAITDKYGNDVYNPYATQLSDLFKSFAATLKLGKVDGTVSIGTDDFFNVYGMKVTAADQKDIKVYLDGTEIAQTQVAFEYDKNTGNITLTKDNLNLQGDVKFEVPVKFEYLYDNYGKSAQTVTAVVVFSKNATTGGGASVEYKTPWGRQWSLPAEVAAKVGEYKAAATVLDLGVNTPDKVAILVNYADLYGETLFAGKWATTIAAFAEITTPDNTLVAEDATSGSILGRDGDVVATYSDYDGTNCKFDLASALGMDTPYVVEATAATATVVPATDLPELVVTPVDNQWIIDAKFFNDINGVPAQTIWDLTSAESSVFAYSAEDIYGEQNKGMWLQYPLFPGEVSFEVAVNADYANNVKGSGNIVLTTYSSTLFPDEPAEKKVVKIPYSNFVPYTSITFDFALILMSESPVTYDAQASEEKIKIEAGGGIAM